MSFSDSAGQLRIQFLALALVILCGGCRMSTSSRSAVPAVTDDQPVASDLIVAGLVRNPHVITVSRDGMTLAEAMARSGGLDRQIPALPPESEIWIRIRRASNSARWFYPLKLLQLENDLVGAIRLFPGDEVTLMPWQDTVLMSENAINGARLLTPLGQNLELGNFIATGEVKTPGPKSLEVDGMPENVFLNEGSIGAEFDQTEAFETAGNTSAVVVLSRRSASNLSTDSFVLPYAGLSLEGRYKYLKDQKILRGDIVNLTRLDQVQDIRNGILAPALQQEMRNPGSQSQNPLLQQMMPSLNLPGGTGGIEMPTIPTLPDTGFRLDSGLRPSDFGL